MQKQDILLSQGQ